MVQQSTDRCWVKIRPLPIGLAVCAYTVVDTFRLLVKGWADEEEMVKQQVVILGMRLWAFHQLNSLRDIDDNEPLDATALKREQFPSAISRRMRLN
ncbi:hypothetical protein Pmar_PMAR017856 [Perkinsus marinus ATCC 50983]|uniref:Uncharacterized protein n=1 Tax=Perkinsus marinus (strain ATCC 50983 / TXsc) TaxID=423536 RepID=C5L7U0_PERM5|nr:hypothetical protein Pmar_PMAR017856 [Perkinsus marinus ATCC 50983]EER07204.1 hypothetical protein Pmar_PMAR017856 [Perkinsus marinus ATCC 50983]|eukprot:XP_002775388.1 hypothetical protein Pmar_PMAR017856 [Perkinsus marinus ATCC 50983]